ncbi:uncharacterized protein LOC125506024 [Triticum urartu]|nr:uncharacterized protein LOC125506024 [Triticum urartu]
MEAILSAVIGDFVSRFISFMTSKYSDLACSEEKQVERLQQLLVRVHAVVEEANGRYITNSGMLLQLKMLAEAMYNGYHALDTVKCNRLIKEGSNEGTSGPFALCLGTPLKRARANSSRSNHRVGGSDLLHGTLSNLETLVSNLTEFAILLGGCERMSRRPYDTYLYVDNFMFGRSIEKQKVLNFLLLHHNAPGSPAVLPITGDNLVGKKTLVANVCNDKRVRGHFASVLHLNGDKFCAEDHGRCASAAGRTLIVVIFASDVDCEEWKKIHHAVACINTESKVIIVSRKESSVKYGTVKPIRLTRLPAEEYIYLFKTLAFGSADPKDHPNLTPIAIELATMLGGSFVAAYSLASVLRKDVSFQFWLSIFNRYKNVTENNLSMFGEHLSLRIRRRAPVDITSFLPSPAAPLLLTRPRTETEVSQRRLPKVTMADLIVDPTIRPKGDFDLVKWKSRLPPYTEFSYFVPSCAEQRHKTTARRKREAAICP